MIVRESAAVHDPLESPMRGGALDAAVAEFTGACRGPTMRARIGISARRWPRRVRGSGRGRRATCAVQAIKLDPDNGEAHNDLGILLAGQGLMDEAIVHFPPRPGAESHPRPTRAATWKRHSSGGRSGLRAPGLAVTDQRHRAVFNGICAGGLRASEFGLRAFVGPGRVPLARPFVVSARAETPFFSGV